MTFFRFTIFSIFLAIIGCTKSAPRYGANNERPPTSAGNQNSTFSTNKAIGFGRVLQQYLGKPYAGRSKYDPGLDCSLFTAEVFKKYAKIQLPRTSEDQYKSGNPIDGDKLAFGDLVFFRTDGSTISHVGVYVGHDEFIHASSSNGIIITSLNEKYWSKRFVGARRVLK
jgi:cell wall-associated NlpC family hydrolase